MLLIVWFVSHICGGPDKRNVLIATACVALQFVTIHPVCQHKLAWDNVAVVGGENSSTKCVPVRCVTRWLNLVNHRVVKCILPLLQNAEGTFLSSGCYLEHMCLFDVVSLLKIKLQMLSLVKQDLESTEVLALDSFTH